MDIKKIGIGIVAVVVILLGFNYFNKENSVTPSRPLGNANPIIPFNYFGFGDNIWYGGSASLRTASTTLCAIQSPSSTSSLIASSLRLDTSSSTATVGWITVNTVPYFGVGTTSVLNRLSIAANSQATLMSTSSALYTSPTTTPTLTMGKVDDTLIPPSNYIVFSLPNATTEALHAFAPVGRCSAVFRTI